MFLSGDPGLEGQESPGTILSANDRDGLVIKSQDGALKLDQFRDQRKKRMEATVFLRGKKMETGTILN